MKVALTEIEWDSWGWEVFDNHGHRVTFGFAKTKALCWVDLRLWYKLLYTLDLDEACECGGHAAGYRAFDAGHSHWCPVAGKNLIYQEPP